MVATIIVCFHNRKQRLLCMEGAVDLLLVLRGSACAFFVYDDPPEPMFFPVIPGRSEGETTLAVGHAPT